MPPAPPAPYGPPTGFYEYDEPMRRRSIWPWLLAALLVVAAVAGGWYVYTKIQDQLNADEAGLGAARPGLDRAAGGAEARGRRAQGAGEAAAERHGRRRPGLRPVPAAGRAHREGQPRRDPRLDRQAEGDRAGGGRPAGDRRGRRPDRAGAEGGRPPDQLRQGDGHRHRPGPEGRHAAGQGRQGADQRLAGAEAGCRPARRRLAVRVGRRRRSRAPGSRSRAATSSRTSRRASSSSRIRARTRSSRRARRSRCSSRRARRSRPSPT